MSAERVCMERQLEPGLGWGYLAAAWRELPPEWVCPEGTHRRGLLGTCQPVLREFYRRAYPRASRP